MEGLRWAMISVILAITSIFLAVIALMLNEHRKNSSQPKPVAIEQCIETNEVPVEVLDSKVNKDSEMEPEPWIPCGNVYLNAYERQQESNIKSNQTEAIQNGSH